MKFVCVVVFAFIVYVPKSSTNTDPTVSTAPAINVESSNTCTSKLFANTPPAKVWNVPPVTSNPPVNVCASDILNVPNPDFVNTPCPVISPSNCDIPL